MELTKAQRNATFRAVAAGKLDPAECEMSLDGKRLVIMHSGTRSNFTAGFMAATGSYVLNVTVGGQAPSPVADFAYSFPDMVKRLQSWAEAVVEWRGPDLWEDLRTWKALAEQRYEDIPNTGFSSEEQDAISAQLSAIKESVKKAFALTAEQRSRIDARFDEAERAAKRVGRKDWILLFMGGIFSLILTDVITPDIAQHILMMAVHGLQHLFTSAPRSIGAE